MSDQIYFAAKYSFTYFNSAFSFSSVVRLRSCTYFVGNVNLDETEISTTVLMSFSLSVCAAMSIHHFTD